MIKPFEKGAFLRGQEYGMHAAALSLEQIWIDEELLSHSDECRMDSRVTVCGRDPKFCQRGLK